MTLRHLVPLLVCAACAPTTDRHALHLFAREADAALASDVVAPLGESLAFHVATAADPAAALAAAPAEQLAAAVVADEALCDGCFRIEREEDLEHFTVHGGGALGVQYGVAALLEAYGVRFFHPQRPHVPATLELVGGAELGVTEEPRLALRGLDLHTLHPTEAYFDFWEPGEAQLARAKRVVDWLVANRGNFLTWPGLDDLQRDPAALAAWSQHTAAILDYAHAHGVKVGIGVQLFGSSNLQKAFDLIDTETDPPDPRAHLQARLAPLLALPFDSLQLSFGEFFGAEPQRFVDRVNDTWAAAQALRPGIQVSATVHVGKAQVVKYAGKDVPYYFLAQYADPHLALWVHTVMFYGLTGSAGGAYGYDTFAEHRAFLEQQVAAGREVAYFPESAYWVAFDDCVPLYFPLYLKARFADLDALRASAPGLRGHVLFSSGWEWGYWQFDAATLRMGYALPQRFEALAEELFRPYGVAGAAFAGGINALANAQQALVDDGLAPYLAGRDVLMDEGRKVGIVSQPDRPQFTELLRLDAAGRAKFKADVVEKLGALATGFEAARDQLLAARMPPDDPFAAETLDGAEVDVLRARFAEAAWDIPLAVADGADPQPLLATLDRTLADARRVVSRRRAGMHDPEPRRLVTARKNATVYPYGYLRYADELCFWDRERTQLRGLASGQSVDVPACVDADL